MMGMGPMMMKIMMRQSKIPSIKEMIKMAKDLGVKFTACTTTFAFMGFRKDDFIDEVDSFAGAATYLQNASEGKISYFI
jgi:peroxiredoxin family protein